MELFTRDSRVNVPAIFAGALVAFGVRFILLSIGTGVAVGTSYLGGSGSVGWFLHFAVQTFIVCAAGGFIGAYYASPRSLLDSVLHAYTAVTLSALVMGFLLASPSNIALRSFANGVPASVSAQLGAPAVAQPTRARVFIFRSVLALEGALVAAWAGSLAYSRRNRFGTVEDIEEESRAALQNPPLSSPEKRIGGNPGRSGNKLPPGGIPGCILGPAHIYCTAFKPSNCLEN